MDRQFKTKFPKKLLGCTPLSVMWPGSKGDKEFHEALCTMGALLSAGLVGIDKTNQNDFTTRK